MNKHLKNYVLDIGLKLLAAGFLGFGGYKFIFTNMYEGILNILIGIIWVAIVMYEKVKYDYEVAQNMLTIAESLHPGILDEVTDNYISIINDEIEDNIDND